MKNPSASDWAEAVRRVRAYYPEDVFPWPSESTDGKSARMARITCDNVEREAHRIMRDRLCVPQLAAWEQSDGSKEGRNDS